jgi:hypothetical protein
MSASALDPFTLSILSATGVALLLCVYALIRRAGQNNRALDDAETDSLRSHTLDELGAVEVHDEQTERMQMPPSWMGADDVDDLDDDGPEAA